MGYVPGYSLCQFFFFSFSVIFLTPDTKCIGLPNPSIICVCVYPHLRCRHEHSPQHCSPADLRSAQSRVGGCTNYGPHPKNTNALKLLTEIQTWTVMKYILIYSSMHSGCWGKNLMIVQTCNRLRARRVFPV